MSIQTQILGVNDPYFSEGFGHGNTKGTVAGEQASARYNNNIRLATVRHAMIDHLRSPPRGFEEVTVRHFSLCRKRLVVQVRRWMVESRRTPIEKKFERAYATLVKLLFSERMKEFAGQNDDVLPPLEEDIDCLRRLDPEFVQHYLSSDTDLKPAATRPTADVEDNERCSDADQKPTATAELDPRLARAVVDMIGTGTLMGNNPWAASDQSKPNAQSETKPAISGEDRGDDDEEEIYK